jgi:MFS transporter, UMF1 family
MNKRNVFVWILYDFANSIVLISFFLYLSQWLVVDAKLSSFWFNSIFLGSTLLLILTALPLAAYSDKIKKRKIFLNISTIGAFVFFGATAVVASLGTQYVWYVFVLYLFAQYFYQFSFVFYNPMIEEISSPEKRGRISGLGQTANWIGEIAGILIALLFVSSGRVAPLLPSVIIFFVLSLPMMILFRERKSVFEEKTAIAETVSEKNGFISHFVRFLKYSPAAFFLIAFFFFNDAIITLSNNFPVYMDKVFGLTDTTKSILLLAILLTSAIGGYLSGWLGDKIGMKKTMKIMLGCWIIVIPLLAITTSFVLMAIETVAIGILFGSVWSVTRAYLSNVLPKKDMNYGFSLYTMMERFATFAGPLTWGLVVMGFGENSAFGYRTAAFVMTAFVVIGYLFLRKIPEDQQKLVS